MKKIIVHHHIFKNSGTTFDEMLKQAFKENAVFEDSKFPFFRYTPFQIEKILFNLSKTSIKSISSHQFPHVTSDIKIKDFEPLSITFLRDPILRIRSIFNFKKKYFDKTITSKNAQNNSFAKWIEITANNKQQLVHINNSQCSFFSANNDGRPDREYTGMEYIYNFDLCKENLKKYFFCGITEEFENSINFLNVKLQKKEIKELNLVSAKNTTSKNLNKPIAERHAEIKDEIGDELFSFLLYLNRQDSELVELCKKQFLFNK